MQFQHSLPNPWPEDLYWFDLLDAYPILVRYSNFYAEDFDRRVGSLHVWYYNKHAEMEANPDNLVDILRMLLVHLGATEYYTEV